MTDAVQYFEAEVVSRITTDLGKTRGELLIKQLEVERAMKMIAALEEQVAAKDEAIRNHELHAQGLRADLDGLREQVRASQAAPVKPKGRRA